MKLTREISSDSGVHMLGLERALKIDIIHPLSEILPEILAVLVEEG
jgi:hypothetical protein